MGTDEGAAAAVVDEAVGLAAEPGERPALARHLASVEKDQGLILAEAGPNRAMEIPRAQRTAVVGPEAGGVGLVRVEFAVANEVQESEVVLVEEGGKAGVGGVFETQVAGAGIRREGAEETELADGVEERLGVRG